MRREFFKEKSVPCVLRRVDEKEAQYTLPYFVETNKSEVRSIRLSILDQNLKPYQLSDIDCTLYLRKNYVDTQRLPTEMAEMLVKRKRETGKPVQKKKAGMRKPAQKKNTGTRKPAQKKKAGMRKPTQKKKKTGNNSVNKKPKRKNTTVRRVKKSIRGQRTV